MSARRSRRLLVAISGHGYGHAAQTAPVVAALLEREPSLHLIIRSGLPERVLREFFPRLAEISPSQHDFGAVMTSPFEVDPDGTAAGYAGVHARHGTVLDKEIATLWALAPDFVLSNISYLSLAAAARLRIPAIGFGSLDWFDIYRHFCGDRPEAQRIESEMLAGYRTTRLFITPTPSMPMQEWAVTPVGPVARVNGSRERTRQILTKRLSLEPGERIVLVSLGGVAGGIDPESWQPVEGVRLIFPGVQMAPRPGIASAARLGLSHLELLAASDALVTKPGYGSFAEAACHGVPVLYAPRVYWPEEPALIDWLEQVAVSHPIPRDELVRGDIGNFLKALWSITPRPPVEPTGNDEAADLILSAVS